MTNAGNNIHEVKFKGIRRNLVLLAVSALATTFIAAKIIHGDSGIRSRDITEADKNKIARAVISCSPDWKYINSINEPEIPLIPGTGKYTWKISTKNDSAQLYFNQGINMYYSFHIIEAMASFKKAAGFDSSCAMFYWAQALTYGPNINDLGYTASPEALKATETAISLSATATDVEQALINAMSARYSADSASTSRVKLNARYTAAMKKLAGEFPASVDAQVLYADALMLEHPWDLWNINGSAKPWTPLIENKLEKILSASPDHPGANHYYIHVMEGSPYAAKALPSARRMAKLTPGLSHTVHMPSHIYLRTGQYNDGISINEAAVAGYQKELNVYAPVSGADFLYLIHNLHMQSNVSMLAGRSVYSSKIAKEAAASVLEDYELLAAPMGTYIQYIKMTPVLVDIRFGNWDQLLATSAPDKRKSYATVLYHFGRGMAFTHRSNTAGARAELELMQEAMKDTLLNMPNGVFSPAIEGAKVAAGLLTGAMAMEARDYPLAINAFYSAATIEEEMVYTEPRDWMLNPKHWLGDAYLKAGQPANAEKTFTKDLLNNSENGWALYGLYQALLAQKKNAAAAAVLVRYSNAFSKADVKLTGAVY